MAIEHAPQKLFRKIHRYRTFRVMLLLGIVAFIAYWFLKGDVFTYLLVGPPLYIIDFLRRYLGPYLEFIPWTHPFLVILPAVVFYYAAMGWLINIAKYERSFLRFFAVGGIIIFMIVIHIYAWYNLQLYYVSYEPYVLAH
ncbi:MAG: hypothetical protein ACOY3K_05400 [Candidatus Omnitrophota bacterium]